VTPKKKTTSTSKNWSTSSREKDHSTRYCRVVFPDPGYFANVLKSKMKYDPFTTYMFLLKNDAFEKNLLRHFDDASIASVLRFLLNENLEVIQEGLVGPLR
jgi:hypothetical protein